MMEKINSFFLSQYNYVLANKLNIEKTVAKKIVMFWRENECQFCCNLSYRGEIISILATFINLQ